MARRRKRILGGYAGLCSTFIAKLANISPNTIRKLLRPCGTTKKNTLNPDIVGEIIFTQRAKNRIREIRSELKDL